MVSHEQLKRIMPYAGHRLTLFVAPLNATMDANEITTPARRAAFLAQIAHESGSLRYTREIASGEAYEGRADLGNTEPGDGVRYKGRGLIQITGRANYRACSIGLYGDPDILLQHPDLIETVAGACDSAGWYWKSRGLNALADLGKFRAITLRVNGGLNGYADRLEYFHRAQKVLAQ